MSTVLELLLASVDRSFPFGVPQERTCQPAGQFLADFEQRHVAPGTGRTLYLEVIAVERIQVQQCPDDEHVDWHPDRAPPVRIPAEHPRVRLGGEVLHRVLLVTNPKPEGMLQVISRKGADAVGSQELFLVEHVREYA